MKTVLIYSSPAVDARIDMGRPQGGTETTYALLMDALREEGINVEAITQDDCDRDCDALIISRYAQAPQRIRAKKTVVYAVDYQHHLYNHHRGLPIYCMSDWQAGLFRNAGFKADTIYPLLAPFVYEYATSVRKVPGRWIYASSIIKGIDSTLRAWKAAPRGNELFVTTTGYDEADPNECAKAGATWIGTLSPRELTRTIASCEGMFYRNGGHPETFGIVVAVARALGLKLDVECEGHAPCGLAESRTALDLTPRTIARRWMEVLFDEPRQTVSKPASPLKLISVTMTGNSEKTIGETIASVVDWVDVVLLLDTGVTDKTIDIAERAAKGKLVTRTFKWCNDFAAGRNALLFNATEYARDKFAKQPTWAVMIDSDETIDLRGEDIRVELADATANHGVIAHHSGHYTQPRFFKLPAPFTFSGKTHEAYPAKGDSFQLGKVVFCDKDKTPEQWKAKWERDLVILTQQVHDAPDAARWRYYLAETLRYLGRTEEAIRQYRRCASLSSWDEEAAWAHYRAAVEFSTLDRWESVLECCIAGLEKHPGIGELAWFAGVACERLGRFAHAVSWADMAIIHDHENPITKARVGFKHPAGLWEGPYDILRHNLRKIGDEAGADAAENTYQVKLRQRTGAQ